MERKRNAQLNSWALTEGIDPSYLQYQISQQPIPTEYKWETHLMRSVFHIMHATPEEWAYNASDLTRGYFTYAGESDLEIMYPGITSGVYLKERFNNTPNCYIPSEGHLRSILFAGNENVRQLRDFVYRELDIFDQQFPTVMNEVGNTLPLSLTVQQVLGVVENHMANDPKLRRTGEESIAHIYRGILDTLRFIKTVNTQRLKPLLNEYSRPMAFFTKRTATGLLLTFTLHDFCEDQFDANNPAYEYAGYVQFSPQGGLHVQRVKRKKGETTPNPKEEQIEEELTVNTDYVITGKIINAVDSLNVQNAQGEPLEEVSKHALRERKLDTRFTADQRVMDIFGILSKFMDRNDNLRTYPFKYDKHTRQYVSVPHEKIREKCLEVIRQFNPMNRIVFQTFAGPIHPFIRVLVKQLHSLDPDSFSEEYLPHYHSLMYHEVLKLFPTRVASQMLFGCTHDEIYRTPLVAKGLPTVL